MSNPTVCIETSRNAASAIESARAAIAEISRTSKALATFATSDHSIDRCLAEVSHRRAWLSLTVITRDTYPWRCGAEYDARRANADAASESLRQAVRVSEGLHPGLFEEPDRPRECATTSG